MWFDESVVYQIYPLGLCGAPREHDGNLAHRILRILDWIPNFSPVSVYLSALMNRQIAGS